MLPPPSTGVLCRIALSETPGEVVKRTVKKEPIDPERVRRIAAEGFSWIDRRFVREGFMERLPPEAILFYFFLVAVGDARGLSFYADPSISRKLKLNPEELSQSRARLIDADLILYRYPLYQVLSEGHAPAWLFGFPICVDSTAAPLKRLTE